MADVPAVPAAPEGPTSDEEGGAAALDLGSLFEQAQAMAESMAEAQQAASETVVEGSAGGGMVRVEVTGTFEFQRLHIDPSVIDPSDPGMLEDLVIAALRDAGRRVGELQQQSLGGLGDLGGLLGGP